MNEHSRMDDFVRIKQAGVGNFTEIWLVKPRDDEDKRYALKIVEKRRVNQLRKQADILMEKHCLLKLADCEYVIDLQETFKDDLNVYLLMEFADGGELWNQIMNCGLFSKKLILYFASHLAKAIEQIHAKGIVHRDLKVREPIISFLELFGFSKTVFKQERNRRRGE